MSFLHLLIGLSSLVAASASSDCEHPLFRVPLEDMISSASLIIKVKVHEIGARSAVNTVCALKGSAPERFFVEGLNSYGLCTCCVKPGMEIILFLSATQSEYYDVNYQGLQPFHYTEAEIRSQLQLERNKCLQNEPKIAKPDATLRPTSHRPPTTHAPPSVTDVCGQPQNQPDLSLSTAVEGSFPWHAVVWFKRPGKKLCDATLIHSQWVLTSAHCVENLKAKHLKVGLGVRDPLVKKENGRQVSKVKSIRLHPSYQNGSFLYDVAVLKLFPEPIKPTQFVQPVCLTGNALPSDVPCVVTSVTNEGLRQSQVTVASKRQQTTHKKLTLCSGAKNQIQEGFFANFDSSPLVCRHLDGSWHQHGIASSEKGCMTPNYSVFSRLSNQKLSRWIKQVTRNNIAIRS